MEFEHRCEFETKLEKMGVNQGCSPTRNETRVMEINKETLVWGRGTSVSDRIQIRMDPHSFCVLDPDPDT